MGYNQRVFYPTPCAPLSFKGRGEEREACASPELTSGRDSSILRRE